MKHSKHLKVGALAVFIALVVIVIWGVLRKVPVAIQVEPQTAVIAVDGQKVVSGDKIGFGRKTIEITAPNYTPYKSDKKFGFFSTLRLTVQLRNLPNAQKIADGDLLQQDREGNLYYRGGDKIFEISGPGLQDLPIAQTDFSKLTSIVFSPDGKLAWIKFADGVNGIFDFSRYNVTNQEIVRWDDGIATVSWLPQSNAKTPAKQRLIYLKDGVLYKTDPLRVNVERLLDVSSESVIDGYMEITPSQDIMIIVANDNLYFLELGALTLSKAASGGVSSATLAPDGKAVVFTQNGRLVYQTFYLPDQFSSNLQDIANLGKIIVGQPAQLNVAGQAKDGYFSKDSAFFTVLTPAGITTIHLNSKTATKFYHQLLPAGSALMRPFNELTAYLSANGAIYTIKLDYGIY